MTDELAATAMTPTGATPVAPMLLAVLELFVQGQAADLELLDFALRAADELDDVERLVVGMVRRGSPYREEADIREALEEPLRQVRSLIERAPSIGPDKLLEELLAQFAAHATDTQVASVVPDLMRAIARPRGTSRIRASLLVVMVAGLEHFIVQTAHLVAQSDPRRILGAMHQIDGVALIGAESIDTLRSALVAREIETWTRQSTELILNMLHSRLDVDVPAVSVASSEAILRRNVIVHNGGFASAEYCRRIVGLGLDAQEEGTRIDVPDRYLREVADALFATACGTFLAALATNPKGMPADFDKALLEFYYRLILDARYQGAAMIADWCRRRSDLRPEYAATHSVNYWLAMQRSGRSQECRREVDAWGIGGLAEPYRAAKLALQGKVHEARALVSTLLRTGALTREDWLSWPVFAEVRDLGPIGAADTPTNDRRPASTAGGAAQE